MRRHQRRSNLSAAEIEAFVKTATLLHDQLMDYSRNLKTSGEHYKQIAAVDAQLLTGIQVLTAKDLPWVGGNAIRIGFSKE